MEPSIQYARTSDGVDIAYYVVGNGPPFMIMEQATESNIQTDWDNDDLRARYEMIARSFTLVRFDSASEAIAVSLAFAGAAEATQLRLHLGLHAGDVIREANNVFGGAVNVAARISALAAPGEVLVSDVVRALARTSAGVGFEDRGEHVLKGIAEPHRLFAVRAR